jgi:hypothetical protein
MSNKDLALLGNGILVTGVFCPIISVPFLGTQNYFQNGRGDGSIILCIAAISFVFILKGWFRAVLVMGGLSLFVPLFTFFSLLYRLNSLHDSMKADLKDNPFAGLAEAAVQSVQIQWGWALLIGGAITLMVAAWRAINEQRLSVFMTVGDEAGASLTRMSAWNGFKIALDRRLGLGMLAAALFLAVFVIWHFYGSLGPNQSAKSGVLPQPTSQLLNSRAASDVRTLQGHTDSVGSVSFSPDGRTLASGSDDKTINLCDVASGQLLRTLRGHTGYVPAVAFSPDGRTLASGSFDKTVKLWDVASGGVLRTLKGHTGKVTSVVFSPDGRTLATGSWDQTIRLWDVASGQQSHILQGHTDILHSVAFSPDGLTLASGSNDGTIKLWDVANGQLLRTLRGSAQTEYVLSVAFSPDGRTLASGSDHNAIMLWDVTSGEVLRSLQSQTEGVQSVAFSPDGRTLGSGSNDGNIKLWDVASGQVLRTMRGHAQFVSSVAFSPDGRTLASGGFDKAIKLWDVVGRKN